MGRSEIENQITTGVEIERELPHLRLIFIRLGSVLLEEGEILSRDGEMSGAEIVTPRKERVEMEANPQAAGLPDWECVTRWCSENSGSSIEGGGDGIRSSN